MDFTSTNIDLVDMLEEIRQSDNNIHDRIGHECNTTFKGHTVYTPFEVHFTFTWVQNGNTFQKIVDVKLDNPELEFDGEDYHGEI